MAEGNQLLRGSLEVEAFRRNYSALYDALEQADLAGGLSMKLYSVAIISGESMDVLQQAMLPRGQKARLLLQAVERSIKTDNSAFWTFVAVLEKERVLVHTAELLRLHYGKFLNTVWAQCLNREFSLIRHACVATVARAPPFWWAANIHSHTHKDRKLLSYS